VKSCPSERTRPPGHGVALHSGTTGVVPCAFLCLPGARELLDQVHHEVELTVVWANFGARTS